MYSTQFNSCGENIVGSKLKVMTSATYTAHVLQIRLLDTLRTTSKDKVCNLPHILAMPSCRERAFGTHFRVKMCLQMS